MSGFDAYVDAVRENAVWTGHSVVVTEVLILGPFAQPDVLLRSLTGIKAQLAVHRVLPALMFPTHAGIRYGSSAIRTLCGNARRWF